MKRAEGACLAVLIAALAAVPLLSASNALMNFLIVTLIIALVAQGWNLLGGFGGQISFGHAAFFGTGAYVTAIVQQRLGINAWAGFVIGIAAGGVAGYIIGYLSFRSGLRGSYFALVTLAFAEVLRILANVAPITGSASGLLLTLDMRAANFQFASRAIFLWLLVGAVALTALMNALLVRGKFGAQLVAVRENELAAAALGVDALRTKLIAITLSAAISAAAGCFYMQYFLFIDSSLAYGSWISIEALLAPIIGGIGTVVGPLLGALILRGLGEVTKSLVGGAPGIDLVVFAVLLIMAVAFLPRGLAGLLAPRRHGA